MRHTATKTVLGHGLLERGQPSISRATFYVYCLLLTEDSPCGTMETVAGVCMLAMRLLVCLLADIRCELIALPQSIQDFKESMCQRLPEILLAEMPQRHLPTSAQRHILSNAVA